MSRTNIGSGKGNSRRQLLPDPSKSANCVTSVWWTYLDQNMGENFSNQNPSCTLQVLFLKLCFCENRTRITITKISCLSLNCRLSKNWEAYIKRMWSRLPCFCWKRPWKITLFCFLLVCNLKLGKRSCLPMTVPMLYLLWHHADTWFYHLRNIHPKHYHKNGSAQCCETERWGEMAFISG